MIFGLVVMDDSVVFQYWTFSDHHALQRSDLHCQERRDVHHRGADLPISGRSSSGSLRSQWITIHGELNCFNCVFDQSVFRALWITICLAVSFLEFLRIILINFSELWITICLNAISLAAWGSQMQSSFPGQGGIILTIPRSTCHPMSSFFHLFNRVESVLADC